MHSNLKKTGSMSTIKIFTLLAFVLGGTVTTQAQSFLIFFADDGYDKKKTLVISDIIPLEKTDCSFDDVYHTRSYDSQVMVGYKESEYPENVDEIVGHPINVWNKYIRENDFFDREINDGTCLLINKEWIAEKVWERLKEEVKGRHLIRAKKFKYKCD